MSLNCISLYGEVFLLFTPIDINGVDKITPVTQTHIHKSDHWQFNQRANRMSNESFVYTALLLPCHPSPLQGSSSLHSLASQDIFESQENRQIRQAKAFQAWCNHFWELFSDITDTLI